MVTHEAGGAPTRAPTDGLTVRDVALTALSYKLCSWPPREDGSKAPLAEWMTLESLTQLVGAELAPKMLGDRPGRAMWEHRQHVAPTPDEVEALYRDGQTGVGLVCGTVSGNLEVIEFDCRETYGRYVAAARAVGLGDLVDRIEAGYCEDTPGGGVHWPYRCEEIAGNTKLAERPLPDKTIKVLIETRGQGGYIITAPTNGRVHPTGGAYVLRSGGFETIATISPDERRSLWALAETFDEKPVKAKPERPKSSPGAGSDGAEEAPWDRFNREKTWEDILPGWTWVHQRHDGVWLLRRPGKDRGWSATLGYDGSDLLFVFSSSTGFDPRRPYDKFGAWAMLEHDGDQSAAAKVLNDLYSPSWDLDGRSPNGSMGEPEPEPEPSKTLPEVIETFKRWLYLDDVGPIYATLAAVAANRMAGDPLWLTIVGAPSGGKTEVLNAISGLPNVHMAATLTEGALLSGTPKRDKDKGSKGGLLREIGEFGILLCKDFTSILSMNRDPRAVLLAALREIFDGSWTRHVGIDGGRTLAWSGKLGLIAGCTTTIDGHHAVMATMGERFLLYRLPEIDSAEQARRALGNTGREAAMRRELAAAVAGLFAGLDLPEAPPPIGERETVGLVALASLAARCRSAVERDRMTREIELIPDPEAPARIAQALRRLYGGLIAIGLERREAWQYVVKVGLDCMPKLRRSVFEFLAVHDDWQTTTAVATDPDVAYPTSAMSAERGTAG
jgi:hypothetical protein